VTNRGLRPCSSSEVGGTLPDSKEGRDGGRDALLASLWAEARYWLKGEHLASGRGEPSDDQANAIIRERLRDVLPDEERPE
jgi:hypothetical protein